MEAISLTASIITRLKKAEIIPTVLDDFYPQLEVNVKWPSNKTANLGNTLKPKKLQDAPSIKLVDITHHWSSPDLKFTITMTDPDAPSRDNPKWSEMCHWIATNVSLSSTQWLQSKPADVITYKPPGPPPKTGKHRYVLVAYAPSNMTTTPLNLTVPENRQHWGFGNEGKGVRDWAEQNGLVPVGANFIYAKNKKQ
ncbi:hypothetical protein, variant [Verruconis gallopava]|uniref:PEBP-like protein n=1 Tax=Verruconis gallopava TaxID=253628 RepID=A0A0D2ABQ0_9PEZI|nr:hypothetical protein, variant [Verruconis gallopava]KIW03955.1 hypothetical protein, variant [Verruconis gallopava]